MPQSRDTASPNDGDSSPGRSGQNPPLVIVSERGRHSQASRRIVRAQAARASAAQSRETRARNREDRHSRHRDSPQSQNEGSGSNSGARPRSHSRRIQPQPQSRPQDHQQLDQHGVQDSAQQPFHESTPSLSREASNAVATLKPLANWITNVLQLSGASLAAAAAALKPDGESYENDNRMGYAMEEVKDAGGLFSSKQLPIALPRGFAMLQSRIAISDPFLLLLSRSACFDYDSPGVSNRLNQLLFDIVMTSATSTLIAGPQPTHPIQEHLRIASVCLAIWSGQRTEGAALADAKYRSGLEAARQEALVLDQNALKDAKSAEAALWAVFIISVTSGYVASFSQLIFGLLEDLQLRHWGEVRNVLINFLYPGASLDGPCKQFYNDLIDGKLA